MSDYKMPLEELCRRYGSEIHVDLWYPQTNREECTAVEVNLMCVRASNGLRVTFDHERNGFVLEMEMYQAHTTECEVGKGSVYKEVGFVDAWECGDEVCPECKVEVMG